MKANIYSHQHLIGEVDLQIGDYTMGGLYGVFTPTDFYIKKIQKTLWLFNNTIEKDFSVLKSLKLKVQLEDGNEIEGVGGITIEDYPEMCNEPIELWILGVDTSLIDILFGEPDWN